MAVAVMTCKALLNAGANSEWLDETGKYAYHLIGAFSTING